MLSLHQMRYTKSSDHWAKPLMSSLLLPVLILAATAATADCLSAIPGCQGVCGGVEIPYPFGIGSTCSRKGFEINCINNGSAHEIAALPAPDQTIQVLHLSVLPFPEARVLLPVAWQCFNSTGDVIGSYMGDVNFNPEGVYRISNTQNELYILGCNTFVYAKGVRWHTGRFSYKYYAGCVAVTNDRNDPRDDACAGVGCCRVGIPPGFTDTTMSMSTGGAWSHADQEFCPCDYAFIVEKGNYTFKASDLLTTHIPNNQTMPLSVDWTMPLRLDWAIRDNGSTSISCAEAPNNPEHEYACRSNRSTCLDSTNGPGYICNCTQGYQGNPYIVGGCTNIIECQFPERYNCPSGSKCIDTDGGYNCQCNLFRRGKKCHPIIPMTVIALLGTFIAIFFLVLLLWFIYMDRKRRMKMACVDKNGGEVLKDGAGIAIFTEEQMKKITNNYGTPIGKGAFGTVFSGEIDKERVAVKLSNFVNKKGGELQQGREFVNEITFQIQNRHTNLVRLVGCCLETNIPVLVYEYISNGNLYNLLHVQTDNVLLLRTRLNIAIGSSEALAYMHSHADQDCIHGDVKSANILLNDDLIPKVSDFGSSRLLSTANYATAVAADMTYMDPMYMSTHRFVRKSDVYSFGIVLLELITRKTVRYRNDRSLPVDFVKSCKETGNARALYDANILSHDGNQCKYCGQCLDMIGDLAVRCLKYDADERPTMAEVVNELKQAANIVKNCEQLDKVSQHTVPST